MKKKAFGLIWKCALAALPFVLFAALFIVFPMHFYNQEYPVWIWQKSILYGEGEDADVIFLGDSIVKSGVMPTVWGEGSYNLALAGGTPIEARYTLKTYLAHHESPKLVIIGFGQNHYIDMDGYWTRDVYFHYLPLTEHLRIIGEAARLNDLPLFDEENETYGESDAFRDTCLYALYTPGKYLPALLNVLGNDGDRLARNRREYAFSEQMRGYYPIGTAESCGVAADSVKYAYFDLSPMQDACMRDMLSMCADAGIRVVIERPPFNQASEDAMDAAFAEQYAAYLESLAADFPGVIVNTQIDVYPDDCFGDECGHLNANGAERYTKSLYERYAYLAEP